MKNKVFLVSGLLVLSACTSVQVNAVTENQANTIQQICIVNNPAMLVRDFVPVLQTRLQYHGIVSRLV